MILMDSNVFMYAAGANHPNKAPCLELLERVARREVEAVVDAEVLQEILHRYRAIGRWEQGQTVFTLARRIVPQVVPISAEVVDEARALLEAHGRLTARDAIHAAVCLRNEGTVICSYDRDFDEVTGLRRLEPQDVE